MDFAALLARGETLTAVSSVVASPSGLTLSGIAAVSGTLAQQRISGGVSGKEYKVTFIVTTTAGNTIEGDGILQVKDL